MTIYTCNCCFKIFDRKSSYKNHTEHKKHPCKPKEYSDNAFLLINPEINQETHEIPEKVTENPEKIKFVNQTLNKNKNKINNNIDVNDNKFVCQYCFNDFTRKDNLKIHIKKYCKVKKEQESAIDDTLKMQIEIQTQQIEELKKRNDMYVEQQIEELKKRNDMYAEQQVKMNELLTLMVQNGIQTHTNAHNSQTHTNAHNTDNTQNNTVNGNVTNNNNNIQIEKIEFGKEDLSKLSDNFFIKTLMNNFGAQIPHKIIEGIHFNLNLKENMNVYITDSSRNKAMIFDGKKWKEETATRVIDNLLDKAILYCENKHDELIEKNNYNEKQKKKITKEMNTINIITNHEPDDYDIDGQPIDNEGNIRSPEVFKERKRLYKLAKEYIGLTLKNKKEVVIENKEIKTKKKKYLKTG
jgi:hypothetical protein